MRKLFHVLSLTMLPLSTGINWLREQLEHWWTQKKIGRGLAVDGPPFLLHMNNYYIFRRNENMQGITAIETAIIKLQNFS